MSTQVRAGKVARLGLAYAVGSFAPQLVNVALTPIFTRYLDTAQMGIVQQAARFVGPLTLIVQLGFFSVLKGRYFQVAAADRGTLVRTVLIGQLLASLAICGLFTAAGWLSTTWLPAAWSTRGESTAAELFLPGLPLSNWQWVYVAWLLIVWQAFFDGLCNLGSGVAQLNERAGIAVGLNWLRYVTHAVLGLIVVVGFGGLGLERQATMFVGCAVAGVAAIVTLLPRARGRFDPALLRATFGKGLSFVPHAIAGLMPQAVTAWLLGRSWSSAANGLFGAAMILPAMTETVLYAINNALYPTLARLMHERTEEARRRQARMYTLWILGMAGLLLAVSMAAPLALRLLLAPAFWEAIDYVPVLALGWLFFGLYLCVGQPVYFIGGGWWLSTASTAAAAVQFAVAVPVIERYGIWGACWSLTAGHVVLFAVVAWAGNKLYPLPWQHRHIAATLLTAGALGAADYWICQSLAWYEMIPVKLALLASWIPLLRLTSVISANDLCRAAHFLRQRIRRTRSTDF